MVSDPLELLLDVLRGTPPPEVEAPERRELRERLEREVAEIHAAGHGVEIPAEIP